MTNSSRVSWVKYLDGLIVILEMGSIGLSSMANVVLAGDISDDLLEKILNGGKNRCRLGGVPDVAQTGSSI
jgi:hypothetical protein